MIALVSLLMFLFPPADTPVAVIEKLHPDLDAVVDAHTAINVIADGFEWVEGPLWVEQEKMLLFSDVMKNRIYKWTAEKGTSVYLEPSGYTAAVPRGKELGSNGLALDPQGQLVICQHGDRRIAVMSASLSDPRPAFITAAGRYTNKKFNSPNDLAIKSNGDIYFTDPPYGLEKGPEDPVRELAFHGVYRIARDGTVSLLTDSLTRPNGIAFFPGEKQLLIANSDPQKPHWYIYDLTGKGALANGRIFFDGAAIFGKEHRTPDGIKISNKGIVFAPGPGGVWIFNKDGLPLGRIKTTLITSNCAFSGDQRTLFITADHCVLRVALK
ncbi:SMP-30/gluconolactonase/LRE family protein [Niabella beijingensis]|uniref:SMP-30/gluconolactonase/LRE family protein n=1 Tax=Niabella beijingensis TaxID=2872700 RepID=UPI001CC1BC36|nr:SMP-30/gluconolactonase/LRE family protein [Niabella beijingensis]MBZ4188699.1 SMP-30/gluconolactonase/LRE family protein [Niabella beijingensis]